MSSGKITVISYEEDKASEWKSFLENSNNGTLFHDLDFLAYHPEGRFNTHHLIFCRKDKIIALLPAAIVKEKNGDAFLKSPYGASVGGFVLQCNIGASTVIDLVASLQQYTITRKLSGIQMRIAPIVYSDCPDDNLSFALKASGFDLKFRWLSHMANLPSDPSEILNRLPRRRRRYVKAAHKNAVTATLADSDQLCEFYTVLLANRKKHGALPTHTLPELEDIFRLLPSKIKLFICKLNEKILAGTLVFELNKRIAYTFYTCHDEEFERFRPSTLSVIRAAEHYAGRGFRYLDFGPTTFDDYSINTGLARFKEDLGGVGFCRDEWWWKNE